MRIIPRVFLFFGLLVVGSLCSSVVRAEDINGTWRFDYGYDMTFTGSGGTFTGTGGAGSSYTWVITNGVLSGNSVSWKESYNEITYLVDRTGTISGDTMSGTWTSSWGQNGNFTATRISGGGGSPTPTPTPGATGSKKPTAISLFCNRVGVLLERASCAATVADAGAPPRSTPTGVITFTSTGGFFPANAQCFPQQTPYSPGIASCTVEFQIPNGFPIGAKFPIDAAYEGDSTFNPSATSHSLIQAGCVGDALNPCSGAVALSFADLPQILKGKIKAIVECGNSKAKRNSVYQPLGLSDAIRKCTGAIVVDAKLGEILSKLSLEEFSKLADSISRVEARQDALLDALRAANDPKYMQMLQQAISDQQKLERLLIQIIKDRGDAAQGQINNFRATRGVAATKRSLNLKLGSSTFSVSNNRVKQVRVTLTRRSARFFRAYAKATADRSCQATFTVKGQRTGTKRKFKMKQTLLIGINP